ncbi:hypothetical protein QQS21_001824 [Conoideocrella luteorostrata]|uniref:Uncharacterized protein n=1 Tax=Conoideocrella luteorostrata TaxID=1105319 RepID=A0AAJ0CYR6_9HYPO|nr:hypothetical protein QQS21_001824 [Conoideocrella luteorostrata]
MDGSRAAQVTSSLHEGMECEFVGKGMADIAGIGIFVGFIGQAILSLLLSLWFFFLSKHSNVDLHYSKGTVEHAVERKRLGFASSMLMIGNDIQMVLGISYMTTAFASAATLDLYHLHLVFDIVSFVGVSNASAMVCWTFCKAKLNDGIDSSQPQSYIRSKYACYFTPSHRITYLFAVMFLALTIVLCVRLDEWAPNRASGRCYHAQLITLTTASHPAADKTYVAITSIWMILAMASAVFVDVHRRRSVLISAFLQFPVHLYMALALRSANQGKLEGEETDENGWDFGQTTAVVLLALAVEELYRKGQEYIVFEREVRRRGVQKGIVNADRVTSRDGELEDLRPQEQSAPEEQAHLNPGPTSGQQSY